MKKIALLLLMVSVFGCTKEVTYNYDYPGDAIAVVARIDPASGLQAFVTRSVPPLDEYETSTLLLPDAVVEVINEAGERTIANYLDGAEFEIIQPGLVAAGQRWKLEVSHPDYPTVISNWVTIPAEISDATLVQSFSNDPSSQELVTNIEFSGRDAPGKNFYLVESYPVMPLKAQFQIRVDAVFDSEFCEFYNYHPPNSIFFPDICFDEETLNFRMTPDVKEFQFSYDYDRYVFAVRHISETYYNFQLDRLNLDDLRGTILEASPSITNVTGGFGVFLASNSVERIYLVE